jgi:hypothetical protein
MKNLFIKFTITTALITLISPLVFAAPKPESKLPSGAYYALGSMFNNSWKEVLNRNGRTCIKIVDGPPSNTRGREEILISSVGNDTLSGGVGSDTITGGIGADRFVYTNFNNSLTPAPDRIIDFNPGQGDRIVVNSLPTALFNTGILSTATYSTLNAAAIAAYQDANPNIAGTQSLAANQAVFFGWNGGNYLSVNDSIAAFNSSSDLLINVTGITGTIATGLLTTNSFFSV